MPQKLNTELLLNAYCQGAFPMADSADSEDFYWVCPEHRGQLPILDLHIPKSLKKALRQKPYRVSVDTDFEGVIRACAEIRNTRSETWINDEIINAYIQLHQDGFAHAVEVWDGTDLVGGLYGLKIGAAFFGESMFSTKTNASKVALVHLVARLWRRGFEILDTQFVNDHLEQFGVYELTHDDYMERLVPALEKKVDFTLSDMSEDQVLNAYLNERAR